MLNTALVTHPALIKTLHFNTKYESKKYFLTFILIDENNVSKISNE